MDLGKALEQRGFESLFLAEHSHIPVDTKTPYPSGGPIPAKYYRTLDPFVALTAAAVATETARPGHRDRAGSPARSDPDGQRGCVTGSGVAGAVSIRRGHRLAARGNRQPRRESRGPGRVVDERLDAMIEIWTQEKARIPRRIREFRSRSTVGRSQSSGPIRRCISAGDRRASSASPG